MSDRANKRILEEGDSDKPQDMDLKILKSGFGRGRSTMSTSVRNNPSTQPNFSLLDLPSTSKQTEEDKLKAQEKSLGFTFDDLENFSSFTSLSSPQVKFDIPSASAYKQKENWFEDDPPPELQPKIRNRPRDLEYAEKVKQEEKQRILNEMKEKMSENISETPKENDETTSANMTNLEGVSTCLPGLPLDDIEEESFAEIIRKYFSTPKRVSVKSATLPIAKYKQQILNTIDTGRVTIIEGPTGCGKTTQVAQYIADDCARCGKNFNIVITQPRRIAATSIANRVAYERGWQLGTVVGYQIGLDRSCVNHDTRILFCTTGVLMQKVIQDKVLDKYSHIIIDEVHERSEETDLLLMIIRILITHMIDVKIIIMSATFDTKPIVEYFTFPIVSPQAEEETELKPIVVKLSETPSEIRLFYLDEMYNLCKANIDKNFQDIVMPQFEKDNPGISHEVYELAVRIIVYCDKIDEQKRPGTQRGAILVFLPGYEEIQEMNARLNVHKTAAKSWRIFPLHSRITHEEQIAVFQKLNTERKIVLATNIAESSITVPDIEYVIDFCLTKSIVCDPETHFPMLQLEWSAKSNCIQRAGRTGRVQAGRVFRLVTKAFYNQLNEYNVPEIVRSPLELSVLRVKQLKHFGTPKTLLGLTIDPPNLSDIHVAVVHLKQVGALSVKRLIRDDEFDDDDQDNQQLWIYDPEDGELTTIGMIMACLPIDVRLSKLILMGHAFDVLEDCITIAACLSNKGMFRRPFNQEMEAYKSRFSWSNRTFSDCFAYLNAFKMYSSMKSAGYFVNDSNKENWCNQSFLQLRKIKEIEVLRDEIITRLKHHNIFIPLRPNEQRDPMREELILKVVICGAFYPNYFIRREIDPDQVDRMVVSKSPFSTVVLQGLPQNEGIIYAKHIRKILQPCGELMDLDFEDTKCFVNFFDENNPLERHQILQHQCLTEHEQKFTKTKWRNTIIKTSVFLAVAMRQWRQVQDIYKYSREITREKLERINRTKMEKLEKNKMLNTSRIHVPMIYSEMKFSHILPSYQCYEFPIFITHIIDAGHFWAQYHDQSTKQALDKISTSISYSTSNKRCDHNTIKVGDLVVAPWKDDYCRAQVIKIQYYDQTKEVKSVSVFYIDYGNVKDLPNVCDLLEIDPTLDPELLNVPAQAFECQLAHIKPSTIKSIDNNWDEQATTYVLVRVDNNENLKAKVFSVVNKIVRIDLIDETDSVCINDLLLIKGFAEKWPESTQSIVDHNARKRAKYIVDAPSGFDLFVDQLDDQLDDQTERKVEKRKILNEYHDEIVEVNIEDSEPKEKRNNVFSHEKIRLRGPMSPLEASFIGITKQTFSQRVSIERDSVNAVILEPDYLSRHTRMLVSSTVHVSQNNLNVIARGTTLMPNIRGLPSLMTLLFAPRAEFRTNKDGTQYTGAICGIGYNEKTKKSYDYLNDVELNFDSEITQSDIEKINIIRYHISSLFETPESVHDFAQGSLTRKQQQIRAKLLQLLERYRRFQQVSEYVSFNWGVINFNAPPIPKCQDDNEEMHILPIHQPLKMPAYSFFDDIKKNISEINNIITSKIKNIPPLTCKLCNVKCYTLPQLENHVICEIHTEQLDNFHREYLADEERMKNQQN